MPDGGAEGFEHHIPTPNLRNRPEGCENSLSNAERLVDIPFLIELRTKEASEQSAPKAVLVRAYDDTLLAHVDPTGVSVLQYDGRVVTKPFVDVEQARHHQ